MKHILLAVSVLFFLGSAKAQVMTLGEIMDSIERQNPVVKMYDQGIRSMDEAAKGARSWMPMRVGAGLFMTPYDVNLWSNRGAMPGRGSAMISLEQMFPNKKTLDIEEDYMTKMSSVEKKNKYAKLNELVQNGKQFYYEWIILRKRLMIVEENEKMLDFMIKNAETRYQNGVGKISAYYKAKAALGNTRNMKMMYENDIKEKRIRLNALMNRDPLTLFEIDTALEFRDYSTLAFTDSLFHQSRSDLKSIDEQIALVKLKQASEQQRLKPSFGVRFEHMFGLGGQPAQYTVMAMADLPFLGWSAKKYKANAESMKWKAEALSSQQATMVNGYSGMGYALRDAFTLKKNQLSLYEQDIIPALKNNYKSMQLGYEQNTEELFMLYDAWEKLNMTQLEYFDLLTKALEIQVTIDRLIEKK